MKDKNTKQLSIRVKCGKAERELAFPITDEILAHMQQIELPRTAEENGAPMHYYVEGNRNIHITLSVQDLRRNF